MPNKTTIIIRNIKVLLKHYLAISRGKISEETEYNALLKIKPCGRNLWWMDSDEYITLIHIIYLRLRESSKTHTDNDNEYIQKNLYHYNAIIEQFSETFEISEDALPSCEAAAGVCDDS